MKISDVVVSAGLVEPSQLQEYARWGMRMDAPDKPVESLDEVLQALHEALEGEEQVEVRETNMDVLKQYLASQKKGKLHLHASAESTADIEVVFGKMALTEEYLIPWQANSVEAMMTNGRSYLVDERRRIYFSAVRELYFGDTKAFMVCTPSDRSADVGK
jgi:hypothetical protein